MELGGSSNKTVENYRIVYTVENSIIELTDISQTIL